MNAPARRGRPPRIRPEIKPNILADQVHAPPLSEYAQNLADTAAKIMADEPIRQPDYSDEITPEQLEAIRRLAGEAANIHSSPAEQIRPSMRPEMREEDPRARAARRAAELRDMGGLDDGTDEFHVPDSDIPDGWSYEWKRYSTYNAQDPSYWGQVLRHGWEPVDAKRHPHMVAGGGNQQIIERKGMVLCERPAEITREMRLKADREARLQVQAKEAEATGKPIGPFDRDNPRLGQKISRTYEAPVAIPD